MVIRTWEVYLMAPLADIEIEALADRASEHGILDIKVAPSRRIIVAETEDEGTVTSIIGLLSEGMLDITELAGIQESKWYYPEFEGEADNEALEVFVSFEE